MTPRRLVRIVQRRVSSLLASSRLDRDVDRELRFHLDALIEEKIAEGLSHDAARLAARRELGNVAALRDACRDQRGVNWWHDLLQDIRYGYRMLVAAPLFTAVALASLSLGIGANAAVLGLMFSIQEDTLPAADADRLIAIHSVSPQDPAATHGVSAADYFAWKERSRTIESIELSIAGPRDLGDDGEIPAERATGQSVTAGYFAMLGVQPIIGRVFTSEEVAVGARLVVLSHALWQRRYGGAADILNRSIPIDSGRSTVIGVMPAGYGYRIPRVEFWTPMQVGTVTLPEPRRLLSAIARLKPGVTQAQAHEDLAAISAQLAREHPPLGGEWAVRVLPLRDEFFGWTREPLIVLEAAVALVLVMACANIAAILLARGTVRRREIAMRLVLGAGRTRVIRQLLTESLLLSTAGGVLGLAVAWAALRGLSAMMPPLGASPIGAMQLDFRMLGLTAVFAIGTGILFGLAPAFSVSRSSPGAPEDRSRLLEWPRANGIRSVLVTSQVALALMLLIGFGLLANSFVRLTQRNLNYDPTGLLTFEVRTAMPQKLLGLHRGFPYFELLGTPSRSLSRIHQRLASIAGAEAVGGISFPPVDSIILPTVDVRGDGETAARDDRPLKAAYFLVTPGVFNVLRTPFVSGRDISDADTASRPWVAIVNEAAARRLWPGEDPIGRRLTLDTVPEEQLREVVGIVRDIPTRHAQTEAQPVIYASLAQQPSRYRAPFGAMFGQMTFFIRHAGDPLSLVPAVKMAVAEIEKKPISAIGTGEQGRDFRAQRGRFKLLLLGVLAGTGSLLAAVGVYGLLAYSVSLRTREIGIRKALGAGPYAVILFLARHVLIVVLTGIAIGWAGAFASTRLIASQLWGITPTDPMTFVGLSLVLLVVAILACIGPAHRAVAVDPTIALRSE